MNMLMYEYSAESFKRVLIRPFNPKVVEIKGTFSISATPLPIKIMGDATISRDGYL